MTAPAPFESVLRRVIERRRAVLLATAALLVPAAVLALRIPQDDAIERMIVRSDAEYEETRAFHAVFEEPKTALVLAESKDPFAPEALAAFFDLEAALTAVPGVHVASAFTAARRLRPDLLAPGRSHELRGLVSGLPSFRGQGLVGDSFLGLAVSLPGAPAGSTEAEAATKEARDRRLAAVEAVARAHEGRFARLRLVGEPFVTAWLERETRAASRLTVPLFGAFVVMVCLALYRSIRAVLSVLLTLFACVIAAQALGGLLGFTHSIVSPLVSLTVMVTAASSLVYLHSRYASRPPGVDLEDHRVKALLNKLPPVTASITAAAVGFAALGVSRIRPIHELGLWCAAGLVATWVFCFTLFPALQKALGAPSHEAAEDRATLAGRAGRALPAWSHRFRLPLLLAALAVALAGGVALIGWPGRLAPLPLETDALDYLPKNAPLVEDARFFEARVAGLQSFGLWVKAAPGSILAPGALRGLDAFAGALEAEPDVGAVLGLPALLRLRRLAVGRGGDAPADEAHWRRQAEDAEQLLLQEEGLRSFVDLRSLGQTRFVVLPAPGARLDPDRLRDRAERLWKEACARHPALQGSEVRLVGQALLERRIASHLVPTLLESLAITAGLIFLAFLLVFRSGAARLLAMIPSVVALLAMFLVMRLFDVPLNVATLLIAATVLGATENDQVHFFWHFQEARARGEGTPAALAHTLRVTGGAIVFATLVNAAGFLALAISDVPPVRQFGLLTATAFLAALLADFTALPAAVWVVSGDRPEPERSRSIPAS